mmetsp:Transcript_15078/g.24399  ORF Transcript_15078/g.24399 Transcript_15078/m.24399 type:complete len:85 (-) Transcript_15078:1159-1413(-)
MKSTEQPYHLGSGRRCPYWDDDECCDASSFPTRDSSSVATTEEPRDGIRCDRLEIETSRVGFPYRVVPRSRLRGTAVRRNIHPT